MPASQATQSLKPRAPLSDADRQRLLVEWNATAVPVPADRCVHQLIEAQAARTPDMVAVIGGDGRLTYAELEGRANQLAHRLRALGVGPDRLVGVALPRTTGLVVALLAIHKAGGAYVPLDPDYPAARLAFMLEDSGAEVVLTHEALRPRVPAPEGVTVLALDTLAEELAAEPVTPPAREVTPAHLAYVIYTSGSTGKPKGVMVEHCNVVNLVTAMDERLGTEPGVWLAVTSISFDISVVEIFWTLSRGFSVVVAEPIQRRSEGDPEAGSLAGLARRHGVTHLQCTPSMARILARDEREHEALKELTHLILGGEALTPSLIAELRERTGATIVNGYGPTEVTVYSVMHIVDEEPGPIPIGRPVINTTAYVLDAERELVRVGEIGELYLGGRSVVRGYRNRPDLTAERFVPNPFGEGRMYATGDLVRYRSDGILDYLGRIDHQVKIRGHRVELGEIEACLCAHDSVRDGVVMAREDTPGDLRLVAYVVPPPGVEAPGPRALREHAAAELPEVMVPSAYVTLQEFPLTPNAKVDRKALPAPPTERPDDVGDYVPPASLLERFIAEAWEEILRLDRVGAADEFFALGGNSLQAAQFINRVQKALGEPVYIVTLFDAPTVGGYAEFLQREYAEAVARHFGGNGSGRAHGTRALDARAVAQFEELIPVRAARHGPDPTPRNAPAMFILAPPRSGTTLLRVMLAGHPALFVAAELQLLGFNTMGERKAAYSGRYALWLDGAIRTVMELRRCDADTARALIAEYEDRDATTRAFYGALQDWLGAGRMLGDKSPQYALDPAALAKAEEDFRDPVYVHLVRHPYAMVRSFEEHRMDQPLYLRGTHDLTPRQLGELVWLVSHRNVGRFLETVPDGRHITIRFEDLVTAPRATMETLCRGVGLPFHEDLLQPYKDVERKMTDGVYAESTPMGDTKFLQRRQIDQSAAEAGRGVAQDDFLSPLTWELAATLGYERP